jgi:SNF2 family DNA or RNA helicase
MLLKEQVRAFVNNTTYQRGLDIYREGKIHEMHLYQDNSYDGIEYDKITAKVQDFHWMNYPVEILINTTDDIIDDIYCSCKTFEKSRSICEHCVAVLLRYINHKTRQEKSSLLDSSPSSGNVRHTTDALSRLLRQQAVAKSLSAIQENTYGKVRLEPEFIYDRSGFSVEFKIGVSRMYVLKDIFAFNDAMEGQQDFAYGKNLQFVHTESSFDESSRPLAKFLCNWAKANLANCEKFSYSQYYFKQKARYIALYGNEVVEFLLAMMGRALNGRAMGSNNKVWEIVRERIPRKLTITGSDQGIELKTGQFTCVTVTDEYRISFYNKKIYLEPMEEIQSILPFLQAMSSVSGNSAFIEAKDVPAFCSEFLPAIEKLYKCCLVNFNPEDYGLQKPEFRIYLDSPDPDIITCRPMVRYGEREFSVYTTEEIALRDMDAELVLKNIVGKYTNEYDSVLQCSMVMNDEELEYELLTEGIPAMQAIGEVYISDAIKRMEVRTAPKAVVGISLDGNLLELSMTANDMSQEELLDILSRYNRKKKYYRLKDGSFFDAQNSGLDTIVELKDGLQLTSRQMLEETMQIPKFRALYLDAQLKDNPAVSAVKSKSFRSLVRNMKTIEDNDFEVPESLEHILREYQKKGFLWLKALCHNGFGGILADDMGLGKTLQVIAFLLSESMERKEIGLAAVQQEKKATCESGMLSSENVTSSTVSTVSAAAHAGRIPRNALIVAPASLVYNWQSEIQRFAPELSPRMVVGTATERQIILYEAGPNDILLTSYDLLKRDINQYNAYRFRCQVIDEAQYIKNANTQAARAVKEIQAEFKLALTGTPVENRLSELWSIFDYLMPGFLYSYKKFREEIEAPVVQNNDENAMKRLQKMIRPFVLRRLKRDVLTDLPDKLEENMFAQLDGVQQQLYNAHVKRLMLTLGKQSEEEFKASKITILAELTRLRQICCDPSLVFDDYCGGSAKADMCISMISNAVEGGHKVLLFSQFTTMLDHLAARLQKEKFRYYMLTGATSKERRAELVEAFNRDDTPVFCISLKAGGTGLNLTAADIVIHFDPWWNIAVQDQATDRAHRIGQKNVVNVYKLIAKGTIEENILKLQEKKRELADQILGGENLSGSSLTKEDLMDIIRLDSVD